METIEAQAIESLERSSSSTIAAPRETPRDTRRAFRERDAAFEKASLCQDRLGKFDRSRSRPSGKSLLGASPKDDYNAIIARALAALARIRDAEFAHGFIRQARRKGTVTVLSVRPKVAELVFQLYGRSLHPELFQVFNRRVVKRGDYEATIDITSAGHVVTWRYQGLTLTEVAASAQHPLPQKRRLLSYRLKGERNDRMECRGGAKYQVGFQLEPVEPEVFWTYQQELCRDGERQGMLHRFNSSGRMALGALSYINVETRNRSLIVQAFHTFPDDYAIVKSQSLFEIP